jgi:hypothetical protein
VKKGFFCLFLLIALVCPLINKAKIVQPRSFKRYQNDFSKTYSKFFKKGDFKQDKQKNVCFWQEQNVKPFTELILSWNALRPTNGKFNIWVNVLHHKWSGWFLLAEWSEKSQQTFVNTTNSPFVHKKHVRLEVKNGRRATAFRVKVEAKNGANIEDLKAIFACVSDMDKFRIEQPNLKLESIRVKGVPRQSQMVLKHPRFFDICSPTSLSMILGYFQHSLCKSFIGGLKDFVPEFADKVHDDSYLDIYGSWPLNVAQAFDSSYGKVFFRVERLNGFEDLYKRLQKKTPVAVSVRGHLTGGAKVYDSGHFIVIVGWDAARRSVLCIDPAFKSSKQTLRAYNIKSFLNAWGTSRNLSYIAIPNKS